MINNRLFQLRNEKNIKQSDVASFLSCASSTISGYENGRDLPNDVLIKLAVYFDVTTDYILGISNEKKPSGDSLSVAIFKLSKLAGDVSPKSSDFLDLLNSAIRYYKAGKPCGDTPLIALNAFLSGLQSSISATSADDGAALLDAANAAVIGALNLTEMPALFYKQKDEF